jgi:hypothetical protein
MPTNEKLNEEFVEFVNAADKRLALKGSSIGHYTFTQQCVKEGEDRLMTFSGGEIGPSHVVRVHTGAGADYVEGTTILHVFLGRTNFVWNNKCGDTVVLRAPNGDVVDWASYDGGVRNGAILKRVPNSNKLTESGALARVG